MRHTHTHPAVAGFHFWKSLACGCDDARVDVNLQKANIHTGDHFIQKGNSKLVEGFGSHRGSSCVQPSSMSRWVPRVPPQPSMYLIIVWLNPGSWWQGQVHLEKRSSQWGHCEKDCARVIEESQNDGANSLQFVKTIPNCRRDRRNSVRDHDIWKFPRSVSLQ